MSLTFLASLFVLFFHYHRLYHIGVDITVENYIIAALSITLLCLITKVQYSTILEYVKANNIKLVLLLK